MAKAIKIPHIIVLSSGQEFNSKAHYRNVPAAVSNIPKIYFETLSVDKPITKGTEHYHTWNMKDGSKLTAWMVPESEVESVVKVRI